MLRLARLPDRTPIKVALALDPELHAQLREYAAIYQETYGETTRIEDLAPLMLQKFLDSDRHFRRARKSATKGD